MVTAPVFQKEITCAQFIREVVLFLKKVAFDNEVRKKAKMCVSWFHKAVPQKERICWFSVAKKEVK